MRIGIDIGGNHIGVGLIEEDKILLAKERNFNKEDKKDLKVSIINYIQKFITELLQEKNMNSDSIELIGIASPGTISNGVIIKAENLGLKNFDIINELKKEYKIPIILINDAKAAALTEKKYGAMKEYDDCVFLTIGTGIGGAAFLRGKLLEPKRTAGFEFGHMTIEKEGKQCNCGKKGCFENYASIQALKKQVTKDLNMDDDISGQYLREQLLIKDDEKVKEDVEEFIDSLKVGICNLIDIFEPEVICLGGSFAYYEGNPIYARLVNKINEENSTFNHGTNHKIVLAKFKNDAGIIGATINNI